MFLGSTIEEYIESISSFPSTVQRSLKRIKQLDEVNCAIIPLSLFFFF